MAKENKQKRYANSIKIVGYLKENNLELTTNRDGVNVIRGSIIIANSETNAHRIQFYMAEYSASGNLNEDFDGMRAMLPTNCISIASYLKNNPDSTFEMACNASSKVWCMARFDEYGTKKGENETSYITLKGFKAGFKTVMDASPFAPCAEFTTEVYISEIKPEVVYNGDDDEEGTETGRLLLTGLIPTYDESVQQISFVAPVEDNIAAYISKNYKEKDTVTLRGDVINIVERKLKKESTENSFGRKEEPQYETTFIHERRIAGGSATPIHQGQEGSISDEVVKNGLAKRMNKFIENAKRKDAVPAEDKTPKKGFVEAQPQQAESNGFSDDLDF